MNNKILDFLKSQDGYVSGEVISRKFHISRSAIWKHIDSLRHLGYTIEAFSRVGYRLVSVSDQLIDCEIKDGLKTKTIGRRIICQQSVSSTMDEAFSLAMKGEAEGAVIFAENQTKGRGRMGRLWNSPKSKGIYFSVILRPSLPPSDIARLTLLAGVAVCEAVNIISSIGATIKWPNDIVIKGRKVAGILTELNAEVDKVKFCIIGIGVNVNTPLKLLPPGATSLKVESGKSYLRVTLAQEILRRLDYWYDILASQGFIPVIERWKKLSLTLGRKVCLKDQNGAIEGKAVGLDEYGGLMIKIKSGVVVKRMSGDVEER